MKQKLKKLFIIDGYAILYRAHYALIRNPLITSYGFHTSALFGFTNQLIKIIKDENPDYLVCAFDSKEKTFRHKIYSDYKANRPEMPEELQKQIPHLWELLDGMNIPVLRKPGYEADDIIGTVTESVLDKNIESFIVSGDKDFMQLINDKIFLYTPGKRNSTPDIYDKDGVIKKWGLPPEKIIDLLALMGDSSDNVPGVAGVGVKTAVKLLKEYDNIESVLDNAPKISNKRVHNGLINGRDKAYLSKELVTIIKDVDVDTNLENFLLKSFDQEALGKKFEELEFYALLKYLAIDAPEKITKKEEKNYQTILDLKALKEMVVELKNAKYLSIDLETTSVNPMLAEIVGISVSYNKNSAFYIPILYPEKKKNNFSDNDLEVALNVMKEFLENKDIRKVGQNIKYDALILFRHGVKVSNIFLDTMIAAHILNPAARSYKLDALSIEFLNYNMVPIEELIGKGKDQITMDLVPLDKISYYAAEDADIVFQLAEIFAPKLEENGQLNFFADIEMPLIDVLMKMENEGVYVDEDLLNEMSLNIGERLDLLVKEIYNIAEEEFNINSTQQLAKILFDDLKLTQIKKRSTAENVLKELVNEHELPELILSYRKLNKLKNTYIDALPASINKNTKRIHSTFNQTIAATGRLSSTGPNFQNIPIRTVEGREIRKSFIAQQKNWGIFSADYSQIELRIMASLSEDDSMIKAFKQGIDIHSTTASKVYKVPLSEVDRTMRSNAKSVNFGIIYGISAFGLAQNIGLSRTEAKDIIEQYFEEFPKVKAYMEFVISRAREFEYVETLMGRRRYLANINSRNAVIRAVDERNAINAPIQGSAADIIKKAMIEIYKEMTDKRMKSKMLLQVHDELVFEMHHSEKEDLKLIVKNKMEQAINLQVPLIVEMGEGFNWLEAH